jgi:hypothetical protein
MKINTSTILWTLIWSLFMGVTAISIGFGALFPSMNLISKPFVCPNGEMTVEKQVYRPYPGKTITTLTWYCTDNFTGSKTELGIFPMALYAGLIYGFLLFLVIIVGIWFLTMRSPSSSPGAVDYTNELAASEKAQRSITHAKFGKTKDSMARLKELQELRDANMVSESEFEQKRAEILKNL